MGVGYTIQFPCELEYLIWHRRATAWKEVAKLRERGDDFSWQETQSIFAKWVGMEYLW